MSNQELKDEIESELYAALEALEVDDLITVRQCAARTQTNVLDLWRRTRDSESEHEPTAA